jgi:hypothetical protein
MVVGCQPYAPADSANVGLSKYKVYETHIGKREFGSSTIVKNRTTRWHLFSAVRGTGASVVITSLTSAGKSCVDCMLRQL